MKVAFQFDAPPTVFDAFWERLFNLSSVSHILIRYNMKIAGNIFHNVSSLIHFSTSLFLINSICVPLWDLVEFKALWDFKCVCRFKCMKEWKGNYLTWNHCALWCSLSLPTCLRQTLIGTSLLLWCDIHLVLAIWLRENSAHISLLMIVSFHLLHIFLGLW